MHLSIRKWLCALPWQHAKQCCQDIRTKYLTILMTKQLKSAKAASLNMFIWCWPGLPLEKQAEVQPTTIICLNNNNSFQL